MKGMVIHVTGFMVLSLICGMRASPSLETEKEILDTILDPKKYHRTIRPPDLLNKSGPVLVRVNTFIRRIDSVDDFNKELSVQLTFRQVWKDSRLSYSNSSETKYITISDPSLVWVPDTFFSNDKTGHFHNILTPNVLVRVSPDGEVLYSIRISLKLSCNMDLKFFPMDSQSCPIMFASYAYTTDDIVYLWKSESPVQVTKNLFISHFTLEEIYTNNCTSKTNTGEYSCLKIDLLFRREFSYYFSQIYRPSIILVILSWLCLWVDPRKTAARVFICMVTFLAFSTKLILFSKNVPDTNYETIYDIWTMTCLTFLLAVILETAIIVLFFSGGRSRKASESTSEEDNDLKIQDPCITPQNQQSNVALRVCNRVLTKYRSAEQKIDFVSRIILPLAFALFNLFYWCSTVKKND